MMIINMKIKAVFNLLNLKFLILEYLKKLVKCLYFAIFQGHQVVYDFNKLIIVILSLLNKQIG